MAIGDRYTQIVLKLTGVVKIISISDEFGVVERGFAGHVHKSTWMACHNRKWASNLAHWSTINIADKRENISKIINTKSGVKLVNDKDEFRYPKDMWDVHECIRY